MKIVLIRSLTAMLFQKMGIICEAYDGGISHVSEALISLSQQFTTQSNIAFHLHLLSTYITVQHKLYLISNYCGFEVSLVKKSSIPILQRKYDYL